MTKRDYIRILKEKNLLKIGLGFGIISTTILRHSDIFDYWLSAVINKGKTQAVYETSDKFRLSDQTVWNIIRSMEETQKPLLQKKV